ncbi:Imidazole glycerol phosphate synthase subunit HisH [Fundidesulfovibrio magnetotacticus]|uniref:Imidazole glycerol phosphate synthase subunit HisH n=1 Tax=Fundidesulfovibrio magnetotacticus TaxID=2730080 RepID=A0A6V8LX70_9BACT|nr:imidazole glycerol phosphate synthase subunit HisH [Fundidesulfovibrio magnetotacticus]GFK94858.1 Imidazole glycerol phosphate synthase subunit HisH [Fundidesulfovibrio magnetotacticus]
MVGVVEYGSGNILSVHNALFMAGADPTPCSTPEDLARAERLVLPGVGAFASCAEGLARAGLREALCREVLERGKPILGICVGMQLMARVSHEDGLHQGLGWLDADVVRLTPADPTLRIPQIGWNDLAWRPGSPLFRGLPPRPDCYFVHSFHLRFDSDEHVEATCDYGGPVTAAARKRNICATQFHPEKSQDVGLAILRNFLEWTP